MAATDQLQILWGQKIKKLVLSFFLNFYITFLATWGCASDFLKIGLLPKFKMAASGQLQNFLWAQNCKT